MGVLKRAAARRCGVFWTATAVGYVAGEIKKLLFPLLAVDLTRSFLAIGPLTYQLRTIRLISFAGGATSHSQTGTDP
jgi:hypothetical protein